MQVAAAKRGREGRVIAGICTGGRREELFILSIGYQVLTVGHTRSVL